MKNLEEDFPRLHESAVAKAAKINKARTGVGCDGFHPKVPSDLTKETREEVVEFLEKVEQSGKWPQQSCTAMFFLIPKNVTSERPIALMLMIRWWEALRTTDGRNSLGKCVGDGGKRSGSFSFGLGERVGDARQFSQGRSCGRCAGTSAARGECSSKDVWWSLPRPSRLSCQGPSGVVCFYVLCLQDALSEVTNFYPPLKLRVFVGDITALVKGRDKETVEVAEKVLRKLKKKRV